MSLYVPVNVKYTYTCINEIWDFHIVDVEDFGLGPFNFGGEVTTLLSNAKIC